MGRAFFWVVAAGLVVLVLAVLAVGAFPPHPKPQDVQHVLPNDKFESK